MEITRDLLFSHRGSGISVCDKNSYVDGDYEMLAFIDDQRHIKYYLELEESTKEKIREFAASADPNISTTQTEKVFRKRPIVVPEDILKDNKESVGNRHKL